MKNLQTKNFCAVKQRRFCTQWSETLLSQWNLLLETRNTIKKIGLEISGRFKFNSRHSRTVRCWTRAVAVPDLIPAWAQTSHYCDNSSDEWFDIPLSFSLQFLNPKTVGRIPWTGDQPVARPLHTQTHNKRKQTFMPWLGFEAKIQVFKREKTIHVLDRAATTIGSNQSHLMLFLALSL
jgi:hypothetical protein